jgi:Na+/melibiose symporter-like transporter
MGYAEVITPGMKFWVGLLFTALGVLLIIASICTAMASSVTRHDYSFRFVTVVLVVLTVIAMLLFFFFILKRREQPIVQAQYVQYNNANMAPVGVVPGPAVAPAAM